MAGTSIIDPGMCTRRAPTDRDQPRLNEDRELDRAIDYRTVDITGAKGRTGHGPWRAILQLSAAKTCIYTET